MLDFVSIEEKSDGRFKKDVVRSIGPEFRVISSKDLMIRGGAFYAIWDEYNGIWSKSEDRARELIDKMVYDYADQNDTREYGLNLKLMINFSSGVWEKWQKYCKTLPDNYHELDKKIIFANTDVKKEDYATKKLPYNLQECSIDAYEELISTLYNPKERFKIEWAIGSVIAGDSKNIQKFIVLYGGPGTGKSTILNIINKMFEGYTSTFDSKALGDGRNDFALESFKNNPLVAIQHDGDLCRIEDNTRLNSIVSHETMTVNEKFKSQYDRRFDTFLFMGTNKPVKITDAKSGILRRLIDVQPSGRTIPFERFQELVDKIDYELGGIAYHCLQVYQNAGGQYFNSYVPNLMFAETNDFFNFMEDNFDFFKEYGEEGFPLKMAWARYKDYCEEAKVPYPMSMRVFKNEMRNYFKEYWDRKDGKYSVFKGFLSEKFKYQSQNEEMFGAMVRKKEWIEFNTNQSIFNQEFAHCPAQYGNADEKPLVAWDLVKTTLADIDTSRLHYVRPPENLIVIDFDLRDQNGEKSLEKNLEAANKWPRTYAETSKSGAGIHLHYYYSGNVEDLSRIYDEGVEIKIFNGKSSLRRKLTVCNDLPIAKISSGLPLREKGKNMVSDYTIKSERDLRNRIAKGLRKEVWPNTKPSMDYIYKVLDDAYNQGLKYDVSDLRPDIQQFALGSSHQADYCLKLINKMHFQSEEISENMEAYGDSAPIVFFDIEIFPNLFIVCWKKQGPDQNVVKMINPSAEDIEKLTKFRLIGFNNRKYDNHMLYAKMMGYSVEELFKLSQRIIVEQDKDAFFGEAYNLSYTDVLDFLSAGNKMSLKKWEIKLGIHHQEFGYGWDQNVPENLWLEAADYCANDVIATEAVFDANQADWDARCILAEWAEMTVNDTTNSLTTRLIVGKDKNPQERFVYTDLSTIFPGYEYNPYGIAQNRYNPGSKISTGKSIYLGEDPSEGGRAIGYPGIYYNVAVLDVESMHPHSAKALNIFGDEYTKNFVGILDARLAIKHKDYDLARKLLPERLHKYLDDPAKAKKLAAALKTAINSVYGLTSASFPNKLRDPRNVDNIVAKYGALFMIELEKEVQKRGGTVVHIKTDSIKIANATPEMIEFVKEYGKKFGFNFDHESTYKKICLVNDAVYIAQYESAEKCLGQYGYVPENNEEEGLKWTATGAQFQVPYVFKMLFSKEPIEFEDLCETKSVTTALYLDMNESLPDVTMWENLKDYRLANPEKLRKMDIKLLEDYADLSDEELDKKIAEGHDYHFIGRVGLFCPVKDGVGGGILLREKDGKYNSANGSKKKDGTPYRWMEADMVKTFGFEDQIDRSYYNSLADDAIDEINKYGDFEAFAADVQNDFMYIPDDGREEIPFEELMNPPVTAA